MEYLAQAVPNTTQEIYEDYDNRPPWSATPVGLVTDRFLQISFAENFSREGLPERAEIYIADAPVEVQELVMGSMGNANHRRGIHNADSFANRRVDAVPLELEALNEAVQKGYASPAGLLHFASALGMRSIELSKVSFEGDQWQNAREDVARAAARAAGHKVWLPEGPIDKGPEYGAAAHKFLGGPTRHKDLSDYDKLLRREELRLDEPDQVGDLLGFYVRFRKYRGAINESTHLREVQSYVIRTDAASGFDRQVAAVLSSLCNPAYHLDASFDAVRSGADIIRFDRRLAHQRMSEVLPGDPQGVARKLASILLADAFLTSLNSHAQNDTLEEQEWAIPLTNTIYAFDPLQGDTAERTREISDQARILKAAKDAGYAALLDQVDPRYQPLLATL